MHFPKSFTKEQTYHEIPNGEISESMPDKSPTSQFTFIHVFPSFFCLAIGLVVGYSIQKTHATEILHAIYYPSKSPIPLDVFTPKIEVPFVPDKRYVGASHQVNENWYNLTKGVQTQKAVYREQETSQQDF